MYEKISHVIVIFQILMYFLKVYSFNTIQCKMSDLLLVHSETYGTRLDETCSPGLV